MTRKPRKPRPQMPEHFIFEITDFEPIYMLNVNHQRDHDWRPRCVGLLDLPPANGRFYASIPHESMGMLLAALTTGHYRYVLLFGPALSRGKSLCQSIHFQRTVDLAEY
jgi:hypothetical protein